MESWGLPPQGGPSADRKKTVVTSRWGVVLTNPGEDMQKAGLEIIDTYIASHQNTISQYIAIFQILELFWWEEM